MVGESFDDAVTVAGGLLAAKPQLVFDGGIALQLGGVAGVDQ
jgi:hypothetical protein